MTGTNLEMKLKVLQKKSWVLIASGLILVFSALPASATPSTTFWTPMTTDIQPFGVVHVGIDNYFRLRKPVTNENSAFPTDFTAPTIGVLPFKRIQMELGIDYFANAAHPWLGNAKIGSPEGSFFKGQPALEVGIWNVGGKFATGRMDADVLYGVVGKAIGHLGRLSAGPYIGNHATLISSDGKHENVGFMVAFDRSFAKAKSSDGSSEYSKWVFAADYQSGKNVLGASGAGLYYYFTPDISLLVGPTFFNDKALNGSWRLSTQLDVNLPKLKLGRIFGKRAK